MATISPSKCQATIVKNFEDRDVAHPYDVWVVDQKLFRATYKAVDGPP